MKIELLYLFFSSISLYLINTVLKKTNFLVENENKSNHRKIFSTKIKKVQSGGLFLIVVLSLLLQNQNIYLSSSLIMMFLLGVSSDIDFISSPKIRFFLQLIIIIFLVIFTSTFVENTRINILDYFIQNPIFCFAFTFFKRMFLRFTN